MPPLGVNCGYSLQGIKITIDVTNDRNAVHLFDVGVLGTIVRNDAIIRNIRSVICDDNTILVGYDDGAGCIVVSYIGRYYNLSSTIRDSQHRIAFFKAGSVTNYRKHCLWKTIELCRKGDIDVAQYSKIVCIFVRSATCLKQCAIQ